MRMYTVEPNQFVLPKDPQQHLHQAHGSKRQFSQVFGDFIKWGLQNDSDLKIKQMETNGLSNGVEGLQTLNFVFL